MPAYLALLRGINVGGNNIIRMADLKACFEDAGFSDVATYIQSGNVVFSAKGKNAERIATEIQRVLSKRFAYEATVVVVSHAMLRGVVQNAPRGFGTKPTQYRYDVMFLKPPLTAKQALADMECKDGVDMAYAGKDAVYFSRLTARATQSKLPKLVAKPMYKRLTIRNWNTTTALLAMVEER